MLNIESSVLLTFLNRFVRVLFMKILISFCNPQMLQAITVTLMAK